MRVLLLIVALSAPALAYLDPATGSLLVQFLIAAVAAVAVGFRRTKYWVMGLFGKAPPKPKEEPADTDLKDEKNESDEVESGETEE